MEDQIDILSSSSSEEEQQEFKEPKRRNRPMGVFRRRDKARKCKWCESTNTPQWRVGPDNCILCNRCGLQYRKTHKAPQKHIQEENQEADITSPSSSSSSSSSSEEEPSTKEPKKRNRATGVFKRNDKNRRCEWCSTTETPQWRVGPDNCILCNRCGQGKYSSERKRILEQQHKEDGEETDEEKQEETVQIIVSLHRTEVHPSVQEVVN